jgi:hypothetical protein
LLLHGSTSCIPAVERTLPCGIRNNNPLLSFIKVNLHHGLSRTQVI